MRKLSVLAFSLFAVPGFAWGPEGHRLVGRIAQGMLTPAAEAQVAATLAPGESIASMASWADQVRPQRKETEPWHFIDIPIGSSGLDMQRDCPTGNCVLAKINEFRKSWRDPTVPADARREALLFLVHFMGDMHQPLHCADNNDRGGNDVTVELFSTRMNLHKVWDSGLIDRLPPEDELFVTLTDRITPARRAEWSHGRVEEWAGESFRAGQKVVYGNLPKVSTGEIPQLGESYERLADSVVEQQLEKAGVRLAAILNEMP